MAMTIVEVDRAVTGGVDTHLDLHVAAALDARGGLLAVEEFATSQPGCEALIAWLAHFGPVAHIGIEGTGSYGAGPARAARAAGIAVVEVDRPNRQERHRKGKSDPVDAVAAARAAQCGHAAGLAKSRDGAVEAMRALVVAKRSLRSNRIKAMNQIRHLAFTAPEPIRASFSGLSRTQLVRQAASLRPRPGGDEVSYAINIALRELGRRIANFDAERGRLDAMLASLVRAAPPSCSVSLAWASTPAPCCWWPLATTPSACPSPPNVATLGTRKPVAVARSAAYQALPGRTPYVRSRRCANPTSAGARADCQLSGRRRPARWRRRR